MRRGRGDRGQATVEFALVLPLLVIGAALLLHLGVTIRVQLQVEHAARAGARAAAVEPDRARAAAIDAVSRLDSDVRVDSVTLSEEFVEVRVVGSAAMIPLLAGVGERRLSASVSMRREDILG